MPWPAQPIFPVGDHLAHLIAVEERNHALWLRAHYRRPPHSGTTSAPLLERRASIWRADPLGQFVNRLA